MINLYHLTVEIYKDDHGIANKNKADEIEKGKIDTKKANRVHRVDGTDRVNNIDKVNGEDKVDKIDRVNRVNKTD